MEAVIVRGSGFAVRQTGGYKLAMARPLRWQFAGAVYHVTSRGSARQKILFNDADRKLFLKTLAHVVSSQGLTSPVFSYMEELQRPFTEASASKESFPGY